MSSGWVSVGATDWVLLVGSRFRRERGQERGCEALFLWSLLLAKERGKSWNQLLRGRRKAKGSRVPCVAEREGSVDKASQLLFGEAKPFKPAGGCCLAGCGRRKIQKKKGEGLAFWLSGCRGRR